MSQTTLEDDDLFGEAAEEVRANVESHLAEARAELPDAEEMWETEADNILGALNGLSSALDVGEAEAHLRQAKKWYVMGERAEAFEDADDLAAELEELEALLETVSEANELVGELTSTVPELRATLGEAADAGTGAGSDSESDPEGEGADEDEENDEDEE